MNEKILIEEVKKWFNLQSNNKNKWCRNSFGVFLKNELNKLGNWKNAKRGNTRKAKRKMEWVLACRAGYDGPFEG